MSILIASSSEFIRLLISFGLKKGGYDAIEAVNGGDAADKLKNEKIDMAIVDLNPETDGIEFIKGVRNKERYKLMPIIALISSDESIKSECSKAGATGLIVKPFLPRQLMDMVRRYLKRGN